MMDRQTTIARWFKRNYTRTENSNDLVESQELFDKLNSYLKHVNKRPVTKSPMGIILRKVFGDIPYVRNGSLSRTHYGCLKEKEINEVGDEDVSTVRYV